MKNECKCSNSGFTICTGWRRSNPYRDEVIDYIKSTGLNYYVGPCETSIEGDYDTLMEIVKNCQLVAAKAGCKAMNTYVKISYKAEGDVLTIDKKVTKHHQ